LPLPQIDWTVVGGSLTFGTLLGACLGALWQQHGKEARRLKTQILTLRADLEEQLRRTETLPSLLSNLSAAQDSGELHEAITRLGREHLKGDFSALFLKEDDSFRIVASEGLSEETHKSLRMPVKKGVGQYICETNRPVRIGKGDHQLSHFRRHREDVNEIVVAPLGIGKRVFGALWVARISPGPFYTNADLGLMAYMAIPLSQALHSGDVFRDFQKTVAGTLIEIARQVEDRDPYSIGHSRRVAELCLKVGQRMRLGERDLENLEIAARLHDMGHLAISIEVLNKPGQLTPEEMDIVRSHPWRAVELLKPFKHLERCLPLIMSHHERYDGSGYPQALKGAGIPVGATLIGMAEFYDALVHDRPHRAALSPQEAVATMKALSGSQFDPHLLTQFLVTVEEEQQTAAKATPRGKPPVARVKLG